MTSHFGTLLSTQPRLKIIVRGHRSEKREIVRSAPDSIPKERRKPRALGPGLRWPISATAKLTFPMDSNPCFSTAKLTFSRQNLLFHGKTYFFTAKLTFPWQNVLFHGKTYFSTWKTSAKGLGRILSRIKMATAFSDNEDEFEDNTEEILIKYYFYRGYQYNDILNFLSTYHNIEISERTLRRRLRMYGLSRKNPEYDIGG